MTHEAKFLEFHKTRPFVYKLFDQYTKELISRGHQRGSSDAVCHRVRWHLGTQLTGEPLRLNDHFTAHYARLWMKENPQHDGFFRLRKTGKKRKSDAS